MNFEGILTWDKPVLSGSVLVIGLTILRSTVYYSVFSILANLGYFLLGSVAATKVFVHIVKDLLNWDVADPLEDFHGKDHCSWPG